MNRLLLNITFMLCCAIAHTSCKNEYLLQGNTDNYFDGSRVYLKTEAKEGWKVIDSCDILHGKFRMKGSADSTFVSALFIGDEAIIPVIIEEGEIEVRLDIRDIRIGGTALNDELSSFIEQKEKFERRMMELERVETNMILDGHTAESAAAHIRDSITAVGKSMDAFVEEFIKEHYNTVLGPCVFQLLCSTLPYPLITTQIERIITDAPDKFMNNDFVQDFLAIARENNKRMEESASSQQEKP